MRYVSGKHPWARRRLLISFLLALLLSGCKLALIGGIPGGTSDSVVHAHFAASALSDVALTDVDAPASVPVLANDLGDELSVATVTQGGHGTVNIDPSGASVSYVPDAGY